MWVLLPLDLWCLPTTLAPHKAFSPLPGPSPAPSLVSYSLFAAKFAFVLNVTVSIYVCILDNRLAAYVPTDVTAAVEKAGLPASSLPDLFAAITNGTVAALEAVPHMDTKILDAFGLATKAAYASAFKVVYLSSLAFAAIALAAALFVEDVDKYLTNYVARAIHKPHIHKGVEDV